MKGEADKLILERLTYWTKLFRGLVLAPLVLLIASTGAWGIWNLHDLQAQMDKATTTLADLQVRTDKAKETVAKDQATADAIKVQLAALASVPKEIATLRAAVQKEIATLQTTVQNVAFVSIVDSISKLSPDQALALAKLMEVHITERGSDIQQLIKLWDPKAMRLTDGADAKKILRQWAAMDSRDDQSTNEWLTNLRKVEPQRTRELFPKATVERSQVEALKALEIKAGAVDSSIEDDGNNWVLVTEWNSQSAE